MTLPDAFAAFFDRRDPSPPTRENYETLRNLIAEFRPDDPLGVFTEDGAVKLDRWLRKSRQNSTVRKLRGLFLTVWQFLARKRLVSEWPMDLRDFPKCEPVRRQPVAWTVQQFQQILAAIPTYCQSRPSEVRNRIWNEARWTCFLKTLWYTGARPAALLEADRADLAAEWLTLRAEHDKTGTEHKCKLPMDLALSLLDLPVFDGDSHLFPPVYSRTAMGDKLRKIIELAGLPHEMYYSSFKKIRKSHLTHLAAALGPDGAAQSVDHSHSGITLEHYIDPTQQPQRVWACDVLPKLS